MSEIVKVRYRDDWICVKRVSVEIPYRKVMIVEYRGERRVVRISDMRMVERTEDLRLVENVIAGIPRIKRLQRRVTIPEEEFEQYSNVELAYRYECSISTIEKRKQALRERREGLL